MNMIKLFLMFLALTQFAFCNAQVFLTKGFNGKTYKVYSSLAAAFKVHPDSVEGLVLGSNDFGDFPTEILRFKNLKYLNICSYKWSNFKDSLSKEQIRINDSLETKRNRIIYYKPNHIKTIPKAIKKLKKIELVDFSTALVSKKVSYQLYKYLPNAARLPDYEIEKKIKDISKE